MTRAGNVWWGDRLVGALSEGPGRLLHFRYDSGWLRDDGFEVSVSLPVTSGSELVEAHSYFSGLLPEGQTRLRICRQLGLASDDDVGLLLAIGGDCAGALSILPEGQHPRDDMAGGSVLSETEFSAMVRAHGANRAMQPGYRQRFSLAGAQDKFTIVRDRQGYRWPSAAEPSTHLVKLETVPHVCFSEYVTNQLAARAGLPSLRMEFCRLDAPDRSGQTTQPYLMLERYDRAVDGRTGQSVRVHQEDMTQALAYPGTLKYEYDGGPALSDIASLVRETVESPVTAVMALRDWQIFNFLAGNWDGHSKNLALLYEPGSIVPALAPFYDLVSIEYLNRVGGAAFSRDMALSVGGSYLPEQINRVAWQRFAGAMRLPPRSVLERVEELAMALPSQAESVVDDFEAKHGTHPVHREYLKMLRRRCHWTLQLSRR